MKSPRPSQLRLFLGDQEEIADNFAGGGGVSEGFFRAIGMRMLAPRELFRAQGFGDEYQIDPVGPNGKRLTKTAQIRMCGNSVPPDLTAAIIRAHAEAA